MADITAYCLDWHIDNSGAFYDLLVEPLKPYANIKLVAWDGHTVPKSSLKKEVVVFCMLPPSREFLNEYSGRVVWLPMWDQAQGYDQDWWNNLPKNVNVIAFSEYVNRRALTANLPTLQLQYFKNPENFHRAEWNSGRTVFYWNRTGLVSPVFLEKLCSNIGATKLIFRAKLDPRIDKKVSYELQNKVGGAQVDSIKVSTYESYQQKVDESNIFIAPRKFEGVGMTFIEAMAKGCCVIAYDAPTMNEYIVNGRNGVLLRNHYASIRENLFGSNQQDWDSGIDFHLSDDQPWGKIAKYNFEKLGARAKTDSLIGFNTWQANIGNYAAFVLGD